MDSNVEVVVGEEQEREGSVDVDEDHTKHSRQDKLVTIESDSLDDIVQCREAVDNVKQMERVEDGTLEQTLHREHQVDEIEQELVVCDQEGQRNPEVLKVDSFRAKLSFVVLFVEEDR